MRAILLDCYLNTNPAKVSGAGKLTKKNLSCAASTQERKTNFLLFSFYFYLVG
jgi:hypothetical protein